LFIGFLFSLFLRYIILQDENNTFYLADLTSRPVNTNSYRVHPIFSVDQKLSLKRNQFCFNDQDDDWLNFMSLSDEENRYRFLFAFFGLESTLGMINWKK
jgi:hypothetical protein